MVIRPKAQEQGRAIRRRRPRPRPRSRPRPRRRRRGEEWWFAQKRKSRVGRSGAEEWVIGGDWSTFLKVIGG